MSQQKWTVKQAVFERELKYSCDKLSFTGFKLPKEKDFLLEVLEELYEIYGDEIRPFNNRLLAEHIKDGTRFMEISVTLPFCIKNKTWSPLIECLGPNWYPYEQELTLRLGGSYTAKNGKKYHVSRGLYLHKSRILREKKEKKNEETDMDFETISV